jgi:hypothetical protein
MDETREAGELNTGTKDHLVGPGGIGGVPETPPIPTLDDLGIDKKPGKAGPAKSPRCQRAPGAHQGRAGA